MEHLRLAQTAVLCERKKKAQESAPIHQIIREEYKESFIDSLFRDRAATFDEQLGKESVNCREDKEMVDQMTVRSQFLKQHSTPRDWMNELCHRGENGFTLKGYEEEFEELNQEVTTVWKQDLAAQAVARQRNPRAAMSSH